MKRFWNRVAKTGKCWEWVGSNNGTGYCQINIEGMHVYVHRLSYQLIHGEIPKGMSVCHRCDNPRCVRPSHLFLGTHQQNINDKMRKGRHNPVKGEASGRSKLTDKEVLSIREEYATGNLTQIQIAQQYNITESVICRIVNKKIWRHI